VTPDGRDVLVLEYDDPAIPPDGQILYVAASDGTDPGGDEVIPIA
jgi:hypothetical protein